MRRATTSLANITIFCRNIEKTTGFYTSVLGLKVTKQSNSLAEMRDSKNNTLILLNVAGNEATLSKGYSPIICYNVQNLDSVIEKIKLHQLPFDGEVTANQLGRLATFRGPEGEMICVTDIQEQHEEEEPKKAVDATSQEIKRILEKLKM